MRTFADLLLAQANEAPGLRDAVDAVAPLVRLVLDIQRRVEDYERGEKDATAANHLEDAALDALREAERRLPHAVEAFKADRAKLAAAEVARRVAAARAVAGAAPRRASTDGIKPSTDGVTPRSTKGKLAGVGRGADVGADGCAPPPPPPPNDEDEERPHRRLRPSTSSPRVPHPPEGRRGGLPPIAEPSASVDVKSHSQSRQPRAQPAPSRMFVSKPPSASEIDKWNRAKAEREEEELRAEAARTATTTDPAQMAARRRFEVERWMEKEKRTGAGADNPNFTPTVGDWRTRVVSARRRREREEAEARTAEDDRAVSHGGGTDDDDAMNPPKASNAATSTTAAADAAAAAAGVDLAAASASLPADWRAFYDATSGEVYYGNATTGETSWDRP